MLAFAFALFVFLLFAYIYKTAFPFRLWSTVYVIPIIYLAISLVGYLVYSSDDYDLIPLFYAITDSNEDLLAGVLAYSISIVSFLLGSFIRLLLLRKPRLGSQVHVLRVSVFNTFRSHTKRNLSVPYLFFMAVSLLLLIFGKGTDSLFARDEYLAVDNKIFLVLGYLFTFPLTLLCGYFSTEKCNVKSRYLSLFFLITLQIVFVASSSRRLLLVPFFFLIGQILGGASRKSLLIVFLLILFLSPLFLHLVIDLRISPQQGLSSLFPNIVNFMHSGFLEYYSEGLALMLTNLTFGLPLAGVVAHLSPIPSELILASLSPLPTYFTIDIYSKSYENFMRLTPFIPCNAVGQLLNAGLFYISVYFFFIGLVAACFDLELRRTSHSFISLLPFALSSAILIAFSVISSQYDLRSATRLLYAAIALPILWRSTMLFSRLILNPSKSY